MEIPLVICDKEIASMERYEFSYWLINISQKFSWTAQTFGHP